MADASYTPIGLGTVPNDDTGTPARTAGSSLNTFLSPLDSALGVDDTGFISNIKLGGTSANNGLNVYEENGTFTPTLLDTNLNPSLGQTYSAQNGFFTKIGDLMHIWGNMTVTGLGSLSNSRSFLGGIPNTPTANGAGSIGKTTGLSMTAGVSPSLDVTSGQAALEIIQFASTTGSSDFQVQTNFTASGSIKFFATIRI